MTRIVSSNAPPGCARLSWLPLLAPALAAALCALLMAAACRADDVPAASVAACPDYARLTVQRAQMLDSMRSLAAQISSLMAGGHVTTPLAGLFSIDVSDPAAVAQRIEELQAMLNGQHSEPLPFANCGSELIALESAQRELARARLQFLQLPEAQRASLINLADSAQTQHQAAQELTARRIGEVAAGDAATIAQADAEAAAVNADSGTERTLAARRVLVERQRGRLADAKLAFVTTLERQLKSDLEAGAQLAALATDARTPAAASSLESAYHRATTLWVELARDGASGSTPDIQAPDLPPLDEGIRVTLTDLPDWPALVAAERELRAEYLDAQNLVSAKRLQRLALHRNLLREATRLRERILASARAAGATPSAPTGITTLELLILELQMIPNQLREGVIGTWQSLRSLKHGTSTPTAVFRRQAVQTSLKVVAGLALMALGARLSRQWLTRIQRVLFASRKYPAAQTFSLWVRRSIPYIPWLWAWLALDFVDRTSAAGDTPWLTVLVLPGRYFVLYKIGLRVARDAGLTPPTGRRSRPARARLVQTERLFRAFARYVLVALIVVHLLDTLVGHLLLHAWLVRTAVIGGAILLFVLCFKASASIAEAASNVLGREAGSRLGDALYGWRGLLLSLPVAAIVTGTVIFDGLKSVGSRFELTKKISARWFLRRAKSHVRTNVHSQALPDEYIAWFDDRAAPDGATRIAPEDDQRDAIEVAVKSWQLDCDGENSLAIFGYNGTGKSTLLLALAEQIEGVKIVHGTVEGKCTTAAAAAAYFSTLFEYDLADGAKALLELDSRIPPTLVLIDDAHNLYLREQGGFEAYRFLASLLNAPTRHIFWCAAFNLYAWKYLEAVFASEQPFRSSLRLETWGDGDIEKLITTRHAASGYELRFDDIILASGGDEDDDYVESRFFRLLWEQAQGVPRTALWLWRNSLVYDGTRTLRVSLPDVATDQRLAALSTDALFVYAAIVRHENLTAAEVVRVASLSMAQVRHALGIGLDTGMLARGQDRRYRMSPGWSHVMSQLLRNRNLIYE